MTGELDTAGPNALGLKRQFIVALRKAVARHIGNGIQVKPSHGLGLALAGLVMGIYSQVSSCMQNAELTREVRHNRGEIQALQHKRRWELASGKRIQLRTAPLPGARDTGTWWGPAKLVESRSTGTWVEVTVYTCDGAQGSGWLRETALKSLDSTSESTCPPNHDLPVPVLVREAGPKARNAWQEFFLGSLPNANTRQAYLRACTHFLKWCHARDLTLDAVRAIHVADWCEELGQDKAISTVKQYLTAVRRLFEEWVTQQVVESNPAHSVQARRLSKQGNRTPSLTRAQVLRLFENFSADCLVDLRDRAVVAVMTFSMARVSEVCALHVEDVNFDADQPSIAVNVKRGQQYGLPIGAPVAEWIRAYIEVADIEDEPESPLFRSVGRGRGAGMVSDRPLSRQDVNSMVRRRFRQAGPECAGGCHTLRATGVRLQLKRGIPIELVSELAGHASIDTTRRYGLRSHSQELRSAQEC